MGQATFVSEELLLVWLLLIVTVVVTYTIQRNRLHWIPPSSCAMLLGIVAGIGARIFGLSKPLRFSPSAFFFAFLPPIVFQAGFAMKKRSFFRNFGAIVTYAGLGTLLSALTFGIGTYMLVLLHIVGRNHLAGAPLIECLLYGSAISSIDPVATLAVLQQVDAPPLLYNLAFGESVVNDAMAILLFRALTAFYDTTPGLSTIPALALRFCVLAAGSLGIGVGVALLAAFLLKRFQQYSAAPEDEDSVVPVGNRAFDPTIYEIAIVVLGSYLSYLLAEVAGMSGIVSLFFAGIVHAHYSYYNVSGYAAVTLAKFFEFSSFLSEIFIFSYLGLQVATNKHQFDFGLFFSAVPMALLSRAANIFVCSRLINAGRRYKLPGNLQSMLWAIGARGAVAYGLVVNLPRADQEQAMGIPAIETATLLVVVLSTFILGSGTVPLLRHFNLEGKDDAEVLGIISSDASGLEHGLTGRPGADDDVAGERSQVHDTFKGVDEMYLKPLFGGKIMSTRRLFEGQSQTYTGLQIDDREEATPHRDMAKGVVPPQVGDLYSD